MPRLSLRLVIGLLGTAVVLTVAAVTLTITYTVSLATVRDIGRKHAVALATTARVRSEAYFDIPVDSMNAIAKQFGLRDWPAPSHDPRNPSTDLHDKFFHVSYAFHDASNFTYTALALMFDDGSGSTSYVQHQAGPTNPRPVLHWESRSAWGYPARNMTGKRRRVYLDDYVEVPPAIVERDSPPWIENYDLRFAAYFLAKNFVGDGSGFWFATQTYYHTGHGPAFVLPAAKPLFNITGHYIGLATLAQPTKAIDEFLLSVKGTAHTEAFLIETGTGLISASTHATPAFTMTAYPVKSQAPTVVPDGCATSHATDYGSDPAIYVGCRLPALRFDAFPALKVAAALRDGAFIATRQQAVEEINADGRFYVASTPVNNGFRFFGFNVVVCIPEADILGDLVKGRNLAIGVTAGVLIVAVVFSFFLFYMLLQPLSDVSERMLSTARLRDTDNVERYSRLAEIQDLQKAYTNMNTAIRSFTRYVPRDVVKDLMSTGQLCTIQMTPQVCTMLFVDIAGFTTICERVPPDALSDLVSKYFDRASRIVMAHDGLIDKFIGDCIMAVWGAPFAVANQEVKATLTGLLLNRETMVDPLAQQWDEAGEVLRVRVGVSTGEVLAGNMGSADRMSYTVIGDPVNLAARLESMNKQFDTRVMVSEMTAERLFGAFVLRLLMPIAVVGKDQPVKVFEVMGLARELDADAQQRLQAADDACLFETSHEGSVLNASFTLADSVLVPVRGAEDAPKPVRMRRSQAATLSMLRDAATQAAGSNVPVTCTVDEVAFAEAHTKAVQLYMGGNFAAALEAFDAMARTLPVSITGLSPSGGGEASASFTLVDTGATTARLAGPPLKSVQIVREQCEQRLRVCTSGSFDGGVFHAVAK